MKKIVPAILAVFYLGTSTGATIHFHYCMDKLVAWGLGQNRTKPNGCPYCGMAKTTSDKPCVKQTKGCCKDELKLVKVEKDQKITDAGFNLVKPILQIADHSIFDLTAFVITSSIIEHPTAHGPPQTANVSLFLRNCVFRI